MTQSSCFSTNRKAFVETNTSNRTRGDLMQHTSTELSIIFIVSKNKSNYRYDNGMHALHTSIE